MAQKQHTYHLYFIGYQIKLYSSLFNNQLHLLQTMNKSRIAREKLIATDKLLNNTNSTTAPASSKQNLLWIAMFFLLAVSATGVAIYIGELGLYQQFYLRIIIAISIAGIASIIPGFFDLQLTWLKNSIRAGGAIGIFIFIYLFNPATLDNSFRPAINLNGTWNYTILISDKDVAIGTANIEHTEGRNIFYINGTITPTHPNNHGFGNSPVLTFRSDFALITHDNIIFHYINNRTEEGIAVANYSPTNTDTLYFNFNDYATKDNDDVPNGEIKFFRVKENKSR